MTRPTGATGAAGATGRHLVLIGLPGSGKTTVGRQLAGTLGWPFLDFDERIERLFGKTVAEIFARHGEPAFREEEVALSRELIATPGYVLSPGGGWITNRPAVAHLRPVSRIIYLRVTPEEALGRMGRWISRRPLFATGDPAETMRRLYDARRQYYEDHADLTVDAGRISRNAVVATIVELLETTKTTDRDDERSL